MVLINYQCYIVLHTAMIMNSAIVERANSALKFVKRDWVVGAVCMGQERLNALLLLFVRQDIPVDADEVVDVFAIKHPIYWVSSTKVLPSILLTTSSFSDVLRCRLASVDRFWSGSGHFLQIDPRMSYSMVSHPTTPLSCMVSHRVLSWVLCYSSCTLLTLRWLLLNTAYVGLHSYADDTQLYTGCSSIDASKSAVQFLHCI